MNERKVTSDPVEYIKKLPKNTLHKVWIEAIDLMRQYNGRSVNLCIALAVGAEVVEDYNITTRYVMPSLEQIKRDFEQ